MNIFILAEDLAQCAKAMPDALISRMQLEHCQILAAAFIEFGLAPLPRKSEIAGSVWKPMSKHHPCCIWAGSSLHNAYYVARLGLEISLEYERRYGRQHACYDALFYAEYLLHSLGASLELTDEIFPLAIGEDCRNECYKLGFLEHPAQKAAEIDVAVQCYRHYMLSRKLHYACWSRSAVPAWWPSNDCNGWLSCRLTKSNFSKTPLPALDTDNEAGTLEYTPLTKARKTKASKTIKPASPTPDELGVPLYTMETEHSAIRAWLAEKLIAKLPTLPTIAKWHAQCAESGGAERLRQFCAEHVSYWADRGYGNA